MKKFLFIAVVAAMVLGMTGTALATYSTGAVFLPPTMQANAEQSMTITFSKAAADAAVSVTPTVKVLGGVSGGAWLTGSSNAVFSGNDVTFNVPSSNAWGGTAGNTLTFSGLGIGFATPGTYTVQVTATGVTTTTQTASVTVVAAPGNVGYDTGTPTVIDPTTGRSAWSYNDLADATAKYEGGYAAFSNTEFVGDYDNPHGGYDTTTNKCKVCHAVHRAEGAYYLLRADSQDDACDYCHIGGSAHSSKVVYDLNSAGKSTPVGHTIGASTYIPDSTIAQWTEAVTLSTVDQDGLPLTETIEVRAYDEQKNDMYRFARHHGHSPADGGNRRNYVPVGPLALRCMSCHQVHNAKAQTWNSISMASLGTAGEYNNLNVSSYKLLKQFPSGSFVGGTDANGQIPVGNISIVPETTLTAGVNFDNVRPSTDTTPTALNLVRDFNDDGDVADAGETVNMNKPTWVAQSFNGEHDPVEPLAEEAIASAVNNASLSVWCADCHNLNIGGWEHLTETELGFKAHTERTHPAPYTGAHSGPGQCYSCHRNDLPRINTGDACSQCHYGTGNYKENRTAGAEYVASDFPHSGEDQDYKLLGSYSILRTDIDSDGDPDATTNTVIDENVQISADKLDDVCIRCHGGIGTFH